MDSVDQLTIKVNAKKDFGKDLSFQIKKRDKMFKFVDHMVNGKQLTLKMKLKKKEFTLVMTINGIDVSKKK
jgi:hypothetical protein